MNLLDQAMWALARLFPAAPPAAWLAVPSGEGPIGADWPQRRGALPAVGLLDLDPLGLVGLHPSVLAFYADTVHHPLRMTAHWRPGARLFGWAWAWAFARRWRQLELPVADDDVTNAVWADADGGRWWVRTFAQTGGVFFVSRFDVVGVFVRIVFPVPGGAWVALVRPSVRDGGLVLDELGGTPGGPGLYLVPTGGTARYVAAVREAIALIPTDTGLTATHTVDLFGLRLLTLRYAIG